MNVNFPDMFNTIKVIHGNRIRSIRQNCVMILQLLSMLPLQLLLYSYFLSHAISSDKNEDITLGQLSGW